MKPMSTNKKDIRHSNRPFKTDKARLNNPNRINNSPWSKFHQNQTKTHSHKVLNKNNSCKKNFPPQKQKRTITNNGKIYVKKQQKEFFYERSKKIRQGSKTNGIKNKESRLENEQKIPNQGQNKGNSRPQSQKAGIKKKQSRESQRGYKYNPEIFPKKELQNIILDRERKNKKPQMNTQYYQVFQQAETNRKNLVKPNRQSNNIKNSLKNEKVTDGIEKKIEKNSHLTKYIELSKRDKLMAQHNKQEKGNGIKIYSQPIITGKAMFINRPEQELKEKHQRQSKNIEAMGLQKQIVQVLPQAQQQQSITEQQMQQLKAKFIAKYNNDQFCLKLDSSPDQWEKVLNIDPWHNIKKLQLYECQITTQKTNIFLNKKWSYLQSLWLDNNPIGSQGISILVRCQFPELKSLYIRRCQIGNQGAKNLKKSPWKHLRTLCIEQNGISTDGLYCLKECNWKNLNEMYLFGNYGHLISLMRFVLFNGQCGVWMKSDNKSIESNVEKVLEQRFIESY